MEKCSIFDEKIAEKFAKAKKEGKTLRYVATLKIENGKPKLKVGLREEALDSSLGTLKGNANKVVIYTDRYYKESPVSIEAPGSGIERTAFRVRSDIEGLFPSSKAA